nr:MAG TPA: hypothetical protein [Bacteriophage sp.]
MHTKKTAVKLSLKKKMLVAVSFSFFGAGKHQKPAPISHKGGHMKKYTCFKLFTYTLYHGCGRN